MANTMLQLPSKLTLQFTSHRRFAVSRQPSASHATPLVVCTTAQPVNAQPISNKRWNVSASSAAVQTPSTTANEAFSVVVNNTQKRTLRPRLRIAVDVDEVLGRFVHALNAYRRDHHDLSYEVHDYHIYNFASVWQCTEDESAHIVHEFFKSQHFREIPVIPGSQESLTRLAQNCDLVVVTSRQHVIKDATLQWLDQHFPDLFVDVHFGNHYALTGPSKTKSEICREVGAQILIDDNPRYALECAEAGIHVLLFDWMDTYRWAKTQCGPNHPLITRVSSWDEVEVELARLHSVQFI